LVSKTWRHLGQNLGGNINFLARKAKIRRREERVISPAMRDVQLGERASRRNSSRKESRLLLESLNAEEKRIGKGVSNYYR